jgi:hypothetical protein
MPKKDFKKGDRVTVIEDWNCEGLVSVRHATVHSCGTKILRLTCDVTGDEFGEALSPYAAVPGDVGVRPLLAGDALAVEALAVSASVIAKHRADLNGRLERRLGDSSIGTKHYVRYTQEQLDALRPEPVLALYVDLLDGIRQRREAKQASRG